MGSAKYCDELKIADARPRSEVGNHAATMRPLPGNTGACARPEQILKMKITVKAALAPDVSGKAGKEREDRPEDDGDAVDALRSEAIEQAAGGQLAQRIGPAEAEEQIAHPLRESDPVPSASCPRPAKGQSDLQS